MRFHIQILVFFILYFGLSYQVNGQLKEVELKSVLLERFSRFMEWPEDLQDSSFIIEVWGNEEMYESISKTYKNRLIEGLPVKVLYIEEAKTSTVGKCHILYIGDCFEENLSQYSANYQAAGALVIGHERQCKNFGATLSFIQRNGKISFCYDEESLVRNRVKISYKLLQLAQKD